MKIEPFFIERFFARHEFSAPHILCASDCESMDVDELMQLAGVAPSALGEVWLGYTESQGLPALRERIAGLYENVGGEEIVTLGAPEEGIFIAMHALLEPGDQVIVLSPCYDSLRNVAEYLGCDVVRWPLKEAEEPQVGGWSLDLDTLEQLVSCQPRLVIVNFPHNPSGVLPSLGEWQTIVELVEGSGAWLFSDEMYRGLELDPGARLPAGCDLNRRTVTLGGLSKTYGLPGLRTGWLVAREPDLREKILGWKDYTTICASATSEYLAEVALRVGDRLAERSLSIIRDNLEFADAFFQRWSSVFRWNRPAAGSVALVGLRSLSANTFSERLLANHGVLLLPGTHLGSDDSHLRFGLGRQNFPLAMAGLEDYLQSLRCDGQGQ